MTTNNLHLDAVVNSAGMAYHGPVESLNLSELQSQFDTNFYGVFRLTKAFIPLFRQQRHGSFIQISSVMARSEIPFFSPYSASKVATESLLETLAFEVAPFNVHVVYLEPGAVNTPFGDHCRKSSDWGDYQPVKNKFDSVYSKNRAQLSAFPQNIFTSPVRVAKLAFYVATHPSSKVRYVVGFENKLYLFFRHLLPSSFWHHFFSRYYSLKLVATKSTKH